METMPFGKVSMWGVIARWKAVLDEYQSLVGDNHVMNGSEWHRSTATPDGIMDP